MTQPNESINKINAWKQTLGKVAPAKHGFVPLKSWPACAHPQEARLAEFRAYPSWRP